MKGWIEHHPLASYFVAAYAISWSIALPLALQAHDLLPYRLPWAVHYLTAFGPAAAALLVTVLTRDHTITARSARRKAAISWWVVGFVSPLLLFVVAQIAARALGQAVPTWSSLGHINYLPDLGAARSGGSVIAAALWHASFNFVTASPNAAGIVAAVTSSLVIAWALVIVLRNDWATLATRAFRRWVRATREEKNARFPAMN